MKKQPIPKLCALLLIVCLMIPTAFAAQKDDGVASPQLSGLSSFATTLSISSGTAYCESAAVVSNSGYSVALTMRLQRSTDQKTWTTIKTWDAARGSSPSLSKQYSVSSGYYYRVYSSANTFKADGTRLGSNWKASYIKYY